MDILSIAILIFVILETSNIILLYFSPTSKKGNGVGVFNAYEKSKKDEEVHLLVKYLINWVAGTKLIFVMLLVVIIIFGNNNVKIFSVIALILSILSFYLRLYPIIRNMDKKNQITPKGYSRTLGIMIAIFVMIFIISFIIFLILLKI